MVNREELLSFLQLAYSSNELIGFDSFFEPLQKLKGQTSNYFIQEVAGRDSIAAMSSFLQLSKNQYTGVILAAALAPAEYGELEHLYQSLLTAAEIAANHGLSYHFSVSKSVPAWKELVAANALTSSMKYGFYTTCLGCHLYLHLLRGIIAVQTGASPIVSGERHFHRGRIKINQSPEAIRAYKKVLESHGVKIVFPVAELDDETRLIELLPRFWEEGKEQLDCLFSGSSKIDDNSYRQIRNNLARYLEEYLIPRGIEVFNSLLKGR